MPAPRIFRFARTSRCAIAGSETRNACAISPVVRPPTSRSVSATRLSAASAGWQHVNTSASRSSGSRSRRPPRLEAPEPADELRLLLEGLLSADAVDGAVAGGRDDPGAGRLRYPVAGQRSSAVANASCTASSASSRSPRTRVRIATARPHSSRKTRSTSSCMPLLQNRADLDGAGSGAAGMSAASRIASSRSGSSVTKPPTTSFVSAKGRP